MSRPAARVGDGHGLDLVGLLLAAGLGLGVSAGLFLGVRRGRLDASGGRRRLRNDHDNSQKAGRGKGRGEGETATTDNLTNGINRAARKKEQGRLSPKKGRSAPRLKLHNGPSSGLRGTNKQPSQRSTRLIGMIERRREERMPEGAQRRPQCGASGVGCGHGLPGRSTAFTDARDHTAHAASGVSCQAASGENLPCCLAFLSFLPVGGPGTGLKILTRNLS